MLLNKCLKHKRFLENKNSHHAYFTAADFTFVGILLYEIENASFNARWFRNENGIEYFVTDDVMGASSEFDYKIGTCIRALTGGGKLQGRISSKAYAILVAVMMPLSVKRAHYMVVFDIKNVVKHKVKFFATIYNKYFEKVIWSREGKANGYLTELGEAVLKFLDIVSNTMKPYCYNPPNEHKESLRRGNTGIYRSDDKMEISPHYESSKRNTKEKLKIIIKKVLEKIIELSTDQKWYFKRIKGRLFFLFNLFRTILSLKQGYVHPFCLCC